MYVFQFIVELIGTAFIVAYLLMFATSLFLTDKRSKRIVKAVAFAVGLLGAVAVLYANITYFNEVRTTIAMIILVSTILILGIMLIIEILQERKAKQQQ